MVVDDEMQTGTSDYAITSSNRLTENRLTENRLTENRLTENRLTENRLTENRLSLNRDASSGVEDSESGREFLTYLARCALPEDLELVVLDVDGQTVMYSFPGLIGLAPEWVDEPLTPSGQRWVSACLLAHVNHYNVSVPISLRGSHPALDATKEEKKDYPVQEAAFYGNLFADRDGDELADLIMLACRGQRRAEDDDSPHLANRVCAEPASSDEDSLTRCGFVDVGECHSQGQHAPGACRSPAGSHGGFDRCYSEGGSQSGGWPASADLYREVITVYLPGD